MTRADELNRFYEEIKDCRRCRLAPVRNHLVFGEGNAEARVMFVGEGPGRDEDLQGRPFVGRSGQLLTSIIEKGMGLTRQTVYICNVVKCRATVDQAGKRDRPPNADEEAACGPFLRRQIAIIAPEAIITLGNPSTRFLLRTKTGITKLRGQWAEYEGIPVMPTFHPSYILRNGGDSSPLKRDVWHDMQLVMDRLDLPGPTSP